MGPRSNLPEREETEICWIEEKRNPACRIRCRISEKAPQSASAKATGRCHIRGFRPFRGSVLHGPLLSGPSLSPTAHESAVQSLSPEQIYCTFVPETSSYNIDPQQYPKEQRINIKLYQKTNNNKSSHSYLEYRSSAWLQIPPHDIVASAHYTYDHAPTRIIPTRSIRIESFALFQVEQRRSPTGRRSRQATHIPSGDTAFLF